MRYHRGNYFWGQIFLRILLILIYREIKYPHTFLHSCSRFLLNTWWENGCTEVWEVNSPLPLATGSLSRAKKSSGEESPLYCFNASHWKTIIVIVRFSSALECLSNGGNKNVFINVMILNHWQIVKSITHLVAIC